MNALAERMQALDATDAEVGAIIGRAPEQIAQWRQGEAEIDAEARVLLRPFLADDGGHAGRLALERIRQHRSQSLLGQGQTAWPSPPEPVLDARGPQ